MGMMRLLAGCLLLASSVAAATEHVVGWTIPLSSDIYSVWASNRTLVVGDSLGERANKFDMGMYNVVQVSRREYEDCTAEDPFWTFNAAPAVVNLDAAGVRYFICTVGNYCALGVRMYVTVQK